MSFAAAVATAEEELAALDARRALLVGAIEHLRQLLSAQSAPAPAAKGGKRGLSEFRSDVLSEQTISRLSDAPPKAGKSKAPAKSKSASTKGASTPSALDDESILAAIARLEPCSPSALATALGGVSRSALRRHLEPLRAAGKVHVEGTTQSRRITLAKTTAPTPVVVRTPSAPPSVVEARDRAITERLRKGSATLGELVDVLPASPALAGEEAVQAVKQALRRLMLKCIVMDVGAKFQLAGR